MTNENMSIDVDAFVDSGIEAGGEKLRQQMIEEGSAFQDEDGNIIPNPDLEQEEPETKPEVDEEPQAKETPEAETPQEADSAMSKLFGKPETEEQTQQRVPVEDHIKLRARAQRAEARVAELESQHQTTPTEEDKSGDEFFGDLEDGDLVRAETVKQAIPKIVEKAVSQAVGQVNQNIEQERTVRQARAQAEIAVKSEKEFAKATPDYDKVTKAAIKLGFLTPEDKLKIFNSDNPAKTCYEMSKQKLLDIQTTLGITPASTGEQTPNEKPVVTEEEEVSDDEFLSVFNSQ